MGGIMEILNLRMYNVRKLKELPIERGVFNTEALMLILKKNCIKGNIKEDRVFKYLDAQEDEMVMSQKISTVMKLNSKNDYKNIENLVIPDIMVVVNNNIVGFAMPLILNHKNIGSIINNDNIDTSIKLFYLKEIGNIIDKVHRTKDNNFKLNFGDLNEYNFILDRNNEVKVIDLDSAYTGDSNPINCAYYLLKNKYLSMVNNKYKTADNGYIIPNDDTDLYCYNMMILNAIAGRPMFKEDINIYYEYLHYLKDIGIDNNIIDSFSRIYVPVENTNPKDYLDSIDKKQAKLLKFDAFKKRR